MSNEPDRSADGFSASGNSPDARGFFWIGSLILLVLLGAALRAMSPVMIPVVFAILISLVVAPMHRRLCAGLPHSLRWLAHVAVMGLLLAVIATFMGALVFAAERVLEAMPALSDRLSELWPSEADAATLLGSQLRDLLGALSGTIGSWFVGQVTTVAKTVAGMTGLFLTTLVVVFFLVLLALSERRGWVGKIEAIWPSEARSAWSDAVGSLTARLRRFLLVRTVIGLLQAALYVGWLALFDVDLLVVWAVLTFVLTYIPNLGSIIAGTLPVFYALITKDWGTALAVAAGLLVIEQVVGNYIDPRLLGRQIVLSPFVILVALLFWGWLWGIAGAFLATPITLSMLVLSNAFAPLRPLALMLSDQSTYDDLDRALAAR